MIGLDTNVLVRYIVRDDRAQAQRADAAIRACTAKEPGFVAMVSLAEMAWVLRSYYRMPKAQLLICIERLFDAQNLVMEGAPAVRMALDRFARANCDFTDCLIERSGHQAGCRHTVTCDVNASKTAGMKLL
ncbi:MAG: PIN domain-containing protein [Terracidiphilus sp.]